MASPQGSNFCEQSAVVREYHSDMASESVGYLWRRYNNLSSPSTTQTRPEKRDSDHGSFFSTFKFVWMEHVKEAWTMMSNALRGSEAAPDAVSKVAQMESVDSSVTEDADVEQSSFQRAVVASARKYSAECQGWRETCAADNGEIESRNVSSKSRAKAKVKQKQEEDDKHSHPDNIYGSSDNRDDAPTTRNSVTTKKKSNRSDERHRSLSPFRRGDILLPRLRLSSRRPGGNRLHRKNVTSLFFSDCICGVPSSNHSMVSVEDDPRSVENRRGPVSAIGNRTKRLDAPSSRMPNDSELPPMTWLALPSDEAEAAGNVLSMSWSSREQSLQARSWNDVMKQREEKAMQHQKQQQQNQHQKQQYRHNLQLQDLQKQQAQQQETQQTQQRQKQSQEAKEKQLQQQQSWRETQPNPRRRIPKAPKRNQGQVEHMAVNDILTTPHSTKRSRSRGRSLIRSIATSRSRSLEHAPRSRSKPAGRPPRSRSRSLSLERRPRSRSRSLSLERSNKSSVLGFHFNRAQPQGPAPGKARGKGQKKKKVALPKRDSHSASIKSPRHPPTSRQHQQQKGFWKFERLR